MSAPTLPPPICWRYRFADWIDDKWETRLSEPFADGAGIKEPLYSTEQITAAVMAERYVLELLVAAGHVTEDQVSQAREIAAAIREGVK